MNLLQSAIIHEELVGNFRTQLEVFEKTMANDRRDSIVQHVWHFQEGDESETSDIDLQDPSSMWEILSDECIAAGLRPQLSRLIQALLRLPVDNFWGDVCWDVACSSINELAGGQSSIFLKEVKANQEIITDRRGNRCAPYRLDPDTYAEFLQRKDEAVKRVNLLTPSRWLAFVSIVSTSMFPPNS